MNILAIDTSGPACSVAVSDPSGLCYEARAVNKLTHSKNLMPMVEEALQKSGKSIRDIQLLACVVGPGSFTGVRIGVSVCQGLARGLSLPSVAIDALEAMAFSVMEEDTLVCPMRDARAGQVYAAAFLNHQRVLNNVALKLQDYLGQIKPLAQRFVFLGDGVEANRERIVQLFGASARFAPDHLLLPGAAAACALALRDLDMAVPPSKLLPLYLRRPQAERQRLQLDE